MRHFLIVGQTGVGKSSFINAVFGSTIAQTSQFEACTKLVKLYGYNTPFGDICLIDTPGLGEADLELDKVYINMIEQSTLLEQCDILIYVSRLNENRFRPNEKQTLQLLAQGLSSLLWSHVWLVLTFAATVPTNILEEVYKKRHSQISSYLRNITAQSNSTPKFESFEKVIVIDNIVKNWALQAVPITSILLR